MPSRKDIDDLQSRVRAAIATLNALKRTPQPMAGDSWVFYRRLIKPAWDYEVHGVTSPTYKKLYKITYNVDRPTTGFMLWYMDYEFDTPAQNISFDTEPVRGDPYSILLQIKHVSYNSDPAGISVRFNIFAPQRGTITVTEV